MPFEVRCYIHLAYRRSFNQRLLGPYWLADYMTATHYVATQMASDEANKTIF